MCVHFSIPYLPHPPPPVAVRSAELPAESTATKPGLVCEIHKQKSRLYLRSSILQLQKLSFLTTMLLFDSSMQFSPEDSTRTAPLSRATSLISPEEAGRRAVIGCGGILL